MIILKRTTLAGEYGIHTAEFMSRGWRGELPTHRLYLIYGRGADGISHSNKKLVYAMMFMSQTLVIKYEILFK